MASLWQRRSEIENVEPVEGDEYDKGLAALDAAFEETQGDVTYELAGKTRNQPIQPKLASILQQASANSGYKIVVFSGGQDVKGQGNRRTGSTRHDRGYAADIRVYDNGTRLSSENRAHHVRLAIFATMLKQLGMESFGSGPGYMGGNHHVDIAISAGQGVATTWGAGGKSANTPSWLKRAFRQQKDLQIKEWLPKYLNGISSCIHSSTMFTPAYMFYYRVQ